MRSERCHKAPNLYFSKKFKDLVHFDNDNLVSVNCEEYEAMVSYIINEGGVEIIDPCQADIIPSFEIKDQEAYCDESHLIKDHIFTWSATDICGNNTILNLTVRMKTHKTADFSFVPSDTIVRCNSQIPLLAELPTLKCGMKELFTEVTNSSPGEDGAYVETRTWTFINDCGEYQSKSQSIYHTNDSDLSCSIIDIPVLNCHSTGNEITVVPSGGSGNYTYAWQVLNGSCHIMGGQNDQTVDVSVSYKTLQIKVTVTDSDGCSTDCYIEAECSPIGGSSIIGSDIQGHILSSVSIADQKYVLRPNPALDNVYLDFSCETNEILKVQITDQLGAVVKSSIINAAKGVNTHLLNIISLKPGIYNVSVISGNEVKTLNLIKIK